MQNLFHSTFKIQKDLAGSKIPSAVIGGLAVAIWGEPRLTADVDLKVLLRRDQASLLADLLLKTHYISLSKKPEEILRKKGFLFVKDEDGVRIDLLLADTPFDEQAIQRAKPVEVASGIGLVVCAPEDLIIYKMISTRPRDREDVRGILHRQKKALDDGYILNWLEQFEKALDDSTLIKEYRILNR